MSASDRLKLGIEYFKKSQYEDALEIFNQAIRENENNKTFFDSRAAVFEKLSRPLDALKDSKKVIDLAPASWQGYARSARLFFHMKKPSASVKMADLALERMKNSDLKRRVEIESIRDRAIKQLERPPCHFTGLPVELQSEIFALVINGSNAKMLALTLVCRSWREVIIGTAKFWRHLVLTPKTTLKKADAWLHRSQGFLSNLRIAPGFSFAKRPDMLRRASSNIWSLLDVLEIHEEVGNIETLLCPEVSGKMKLTSFVMDIAIRHPDLIARLLRSLDTSRTRRAVLKDKRMSERLSLSGLSFTGLTSLQLACNCSGDELLVLLGQNPMLEILILEIVLNKSPSRDAAVELNNLKRFDVSMRFNPVILSFIRFPNLRALLISDASDVPDILSTPTIDSYRLIHLEELHLSRCSFPIHTTSLSSIFQRTKSLTSLTLSCCAPNDINSVVEGLATPVSNGTISPSPTIPCPLLQRIDLSSSPNLKAGPIVRLVKARLCDTSALADNNTDPVAPSVENQDVPLPILYLNLNDCDLIDANALQWLRDKVPHLSFKMKAVKMMKGRI